MAPTAKLTTPRYNLEESVAFETLSQRVDAPGACGKKEAAFGRKWDVAARKWMPMVLNAKDGMAMDETEERDIPTTFSVAPRSQALGSTIIRTLDDFSFYDAGTGKTIGCEALGNPNVNLVLFGTVLEPIGVLGDLFMVESSPNDGIALLPDPEALFAVERLPVPMSTNMARANTPVVASSSSSTAPPPVPTTTSTTNTNNNTTRHRAPRLSAASSMSLSPTELRIVALLQRLVSTRITEQALKETGIGKRINKLRKHPNVEISKRAVATKDNWLELMDSGNAAAATSQHNSTIDLALLKDAVNDIDMFLETDMKSKVTKPKSPVASTTPTPTTSRTPRKARTDEIDDDSIKSYTWDGTQVVPSDESPHAGRLQIMVDFLASAYAYPKDKMIGWRFESHRKGRAVAPTSGMDTYFISPDNKRFRSKNEVARSLGFPGVPTNTPPELPVVVPEKSTTVDESSSSRVMMDTSSTSQLIMDDNGKPVVTKRPRMARTTKKSSPATPTPTMATPGTGEPTPITTITPTPPIKRRRRNNTAPTEGTTTSTSEPSSTNKKDTTISGHLGPSMYEYSAPLPFKTLTDLCARPEPPSFELTEETMKRRAAFNSPRRLRVRLTDLVKLSIDVSAPGKATLYVHTALAVYRLAGDLWPISASPTYRPFFIKTFLTFDAARRVARTAMEYAPVFPPYRLNLVEVLGDVMTRATRYPGSTPTFPIRYSPHPQFHFPKNDFLTSDVVICASYIIGRACKPFLEDYPAVPLLADLIAAKNKRDELKHLHDIKLAQRQGMDLWEMIPAVRVAAVTKNLADGEGGRYLPDDLILLDTKFDWDTAASSVSPDPAVVAAVEQYLKRPRLAQAQTPPLPHYLSFDPVCYDGMDLVEAIRGSKIALSSLPTSCKSLIPATTAVPQSRPLVPLTLPARTLLGITSDNHHHPVALDTSIAGESLTDLSDTFGRCLSIWDGACLVFDGLGVSSELGSFADFRREMLGEGSTTLFVTLLRAMAKDEEARTSMAQAQAQAALHSAQPKPDEDDEDGHDGEDGNRHPGSKREKDMETLVAFADASVDPHALWPPTNAWIVDHNTWPVLLLSAMTFYLRSNPESCVDEAITLGEFSTNHAATADNGVQGAGKNLLSQVFPHHPDFIGKCDDLLRELMMDSECEEFFSHPIDVTKFPDYFTVVKRPMNLRLIRERIAQGHYDIAKAPPGGYMWQQTVLDSLKSSLSQLTRADDQQEQDDGEDEGGGVVETLREATPLQLLEIMCAENKFMGEDCGQCKFCLDKPKFGGYDSLRQMCAVKQMQVMHRPIAPHRESKARLRIRQDNRRKVSLAREEATFKFDEVYAAMDCIGGGHEGIATDVRTVFRNCKLFNKGTTHVYRLAHKFDLLFATMYLHDVVWRDPKYVKPRVVVPRILKGMEEGGASSSVVINGSGSGGSSTSIMPVPFRCGYPSLIATTKAIAEAGDFSLIPTEAKLVAAEFLVNRALDLVQLPPVNLDCQSPRDVGLTQEPLGSTRSFQRLWTNTRWIQETGWVLVEDYQTGTWGFYDDENELDELRASLDDRGKREAQLSAKLDKDLPIVRKVLKTTSEEPALLIKKVEDDSIYLKECTQNHDAAVNALHVLAEKARVSRVEAYGKVVAEHEKAEALRQAEWEKAKLLWKTASAPTGQVYYYHETTRVTQWEAPKELSQTFQAKAPPSIDKLPLTPQEKEVDALEARVKTLASTTRGVMMAIETARSALNKERVVTWLVNAAEKNGVPLPTYRTIPDFETQGLRKRCALLCASMLAVEHFAVGTTCAYFGENQQTATGVLAVNYEVWNRPAVVGEGDVATTQKSLRQQWIDDVTAIVGLVPKGVGLRNRMKNGELMERGGRDLTVLMSALRASLKALHSMFKVTVSDGGDTVANIVEASVNNFLQGRETAKAQGKRLSQSAAVGAKVRMVKDMTEAAERVLSNAWRWTRSLDSARDLHTLGLLLALLRGHLGFVVTDGILQWITEMQVKLLK